MNTMVLTSAGLTTALLNSADLSTAGLGTAALTSAVLGTAGLTMTALNSADLDSRLLYRHLYRLSDMSLALMSKIGRASCRERV